MTNEILEVQNIKINVTSKDNKDYICISDIAKAKNNNSRAADVIRNWLRNRSTLDFLITWEQIYNPDFKVFESEHFKKQVGLLTFTPSVSEWREKTNAIGIYSKIGKYGGTYAHKDIAFEFASAISPIFKLYLIKEFERLKEWDANRLLSKANYLIHTDAVKNYIVPELTDKQIRFVYSEEADVLNVALFGMTAKEWRDNNPDLAKNGNIRDHTDLLHLIILSNLENINAELIKMDINQSERLIKLNKTARDQMNLLKNNRSYEELESLNNNVSLKIENK